MLALLSQILISYSEKRALERDFDGPKIEIRRP